MNVARKRERNIAVTENVGKRFRVKTAADTVGRKGVTELVIVVLGNFSGGKNLLVTVLHCARLYNLFTAAENITVRVEHLEILHKTVGNRYDAARGFAFRRGNDNLRFSVTLGSRNALNSTVYAQCLIDEIYIAPS